MFTDLFYDHNTTSEINTIEKHLHNTKINNLNSTLKDTIRRKKMNVQL